MFFLFLPINYSVVGMNNDNSVNRGVALFPNIIACKRGKSTENRYFCTVVKISHQH